MKKGSTAKHEAFPESWLTDRKSPDANSSASISLDKFGYPVDVLESLKASDCDRWVDTLFTYARWFRQSIARALSRELGESIMVQEQELLWSLPSLVENASLGTRLRVLSILRHIKQVVCDVVDQKKTVKVNNYSEIAYSKEQHQAFILREITRRGYASYGQLWSKNEQLAREAMSCGAEVGNWQKLPTIHDRNEVIYPSVDQEPPALPSKSILPSLTEAISDTDALAELLDAMMTVVSPQAQENEVDQVVLDCFHTYTTAQLLSALYCMRAVDRKLFLQQAYNIGQRMGELDSYAFPTDIHIQFSSEILATPRGLLCASYRIDHLRGFLACFDFLITDTLEDARRTQGWFQNALHQYSPQVLAEWMQRQRPHSPEEIFLEFAQSVGYNGDVREVCEEVSGTINFAICKYCIETNFAGNLFTGSITVDQKSTFSELAQALYYLQASLSSFAREKPQRFVCPTRAPHIIRDLVGCNVTTSELQQWHPIIYDNLPPSVVQDFDPRWSAVLTDRSLTNFAKGKGTSIRAGLQTFKDARKIIREVRANRRQRATETRNENQYHTIPVIHSGLDQPMPAPRQPDGFDILSPRTNRIHRPYEDALKRLDRTDEANPDQDPDLE